MIMKLTLKLTLDFDSDSINVLREIQVHMGKFYNMVNYDFRQGNFMRFYDMYEYYKDHWRFPYLQAHTYQCALKACVKDIKSYIALKKRYDKNPCKHSRPNMPRYKNEKYPMNVIFAKTAIRIHANKLLLSLGKKMKTEKQKKAISVILPEKVLRLLKGKNIKMIQLIYIKKTSSYEARVIYEAGELPLKETGDSMGIDLGVSNLAAITFLNNNKQYLIDGNVLKCKIATYNKWLKEAYSKEMSCTGSKHFKCTKKIYKKFVKRRNYVDSYIHTASRMIVDLAVKEDVKTIVIGDFTTIKKENRLKYFVQIPHTRLKNQIKYKARLVGIEVNEINESYTSSVSSFDLEKVGKSSSDKSRRIVRGLFKTCYGLVNSDINGSLNILRKYDDYKNIPKLISEVRDKGLRESPIRLKVI